MRATYIPRALNLLKQRQPAFSISQVCRARQIHNSPLCREENADQEISVPRKRGRPKKVHAEVTAPVVADLADVQEKASTLGDSTPTPPKARKATKKISELSRLIPPTSLTPAPPRSLRPYQEECIEACLDAIEAGKRRIGISLATGAGKTVIFTNLIGKVQLEDPKRYQTLILVHRRELVEQAARHCVEVYPDKVILCASFAYDRLWRLKCRTFMDRGLQISPSAQFNRCCDQIDWGNLTRTGRN